MKPLVKDTILRPAIITTIAALIAGTIAGGGALADDDAQLQEQIAARFPGSLWYKASGKTPKALQGRLLPLKREGGPEAPASMDLDARPALAGFHDQTIFVVYKPNKSSTGKGTLLSIGDPARDGHGLVIRENAIEFRNHADFDGTFYRWKYEKFPDNAALNDPVLDTQKFFIHPPKADVDETHALASLKDQSKHQVLAIRSDSLGKKGAFRIDVDMENAGILARGAKDKRIEKSAAQRVALSKEGTDMRPYYHTHRIPTICRAKGGRLIAAWEARRDGIGDVGKIDICYAYSDDKGKTWSRAAILAGEKGGGRGGMGNPCLGFDAKSGTVWLLFRSGNHMNAGLLGSKSTDNGKTWGFEDGSLYKTITAHHHRPGPTRIIQIPPDSKSPCAGRMLLSTTMDRDGKSIGIWALEAGTDAWERISVIPNNFTIRKTGPLGSFVGGKVGDGETWRSSFDESTLFYCDANQTVYLSIRKHGWGKSEPSRAPGLAAPIGEFGRAFLRSKDGGKTWSEPVEYYEYAIPGMQQAHIAFRDVLLWFTASGDHVKLFELPSRSSFHCFASFDRGDTWDEALINIPPAEVSSAYYDVLPYVDFGAYSTAVPVDERTVGVLVERGGKLPGGNYGNLTFYPLKIQYDNAMNTEKLTDIAKGRTDIFQNGKKAASFDKRSDINLLSTYATKGKLQMILGADKNAKGYQAPLDGEIAEVILVDKALSDEEMTIVHKYIEKQYSR